MESGKTRSPLSRGPYTTFDNNSRLPGCRSIPPSWHVHPYAATAVGKLVYKSQFLGQYGGMGEAGKRYMASVEQLPEANLAEGISIDDYSTFRATRFSEPV